MRDFEKVFPASFHILNDGNNPRLKAQKTADVIP